MNKNKTIAVLSALILAGATPVFALDISASGSGSAGVGVGSNSTNVDANVSANGSVNENQDTSTSSSGVSSETNSSVSASAGSGVEVSINGNAIVISRSDVESSAQTMVTMSPVSVSSDADLSAYASALVGSDENVSSASLSNEAVSLGYKSRVYLFGFIPMYVDATAVVDAGGNVEINYPWYVFLAKTDAGSLQSEVQATVSGTVASNANASFSNSTQAILVTELHEAMKSSLQASVAAEMSASAQ